MNIAIRNAIEADIPILTGLYRDMYDELTAYNDTFSLNIEELPDLLSTRLKSKLFRVFIAENGGTAIGFILAGISKTERKLKKEGTPFIGSYIDIFVTGGFRGQNAAAMLLDAADEWFRESGADMAEAVILSGNDASKALFGKHGLRPLFDTFYRRI